MKFFTATILLVLACTQLGRAQTSTADLTTLSGKTYKSAKVQRVEPDGITYMFSGGMVKVLFTDLPEAVQKKYGYDPAKADAFARQDDQQQAYLAASSSLEAQRAALQETQRRNDFSIGEAEKKVVVAVKKSGFRGALQLSSSNDAGALGHVYQQTGAAARNGLETDTRDVAGQGEGFVYGVEGADKSIWTGMLYPCGTYRFEAVSGALRTVSAYATTPEAALAHLSGSSR